MSIFETPDQSSFFNFNNPAFLGLLGGLGQAAQPSRVPMGFGATLGMAASGLASGQKQGLEQKLQNLQIQQAQLAAQQNQSRLNAVQGLFGGQSQPRPQTPMGFPQANGPAMPATPAPQGEQGGVDSILQGSGVSPQQAQFMLTMDPTGKSLLEAISKGAEPYTLARPGAQRRQGDQVVATAPQITDPNKPFDAEGNPNTAVQQYEQGLRAPPLLSPQVEAQRIRIAGAEQAARAGAAGEKWDEPKLVEYTDENGQIKQATAQQNRATGQWSLAAQGHPAITGNDLRVLNASQVPGGGRTAGQVNRILSAGELVTSGLENISDLPSVASFGLMGQAAQPSTIAGSLVRRVTPQEAQSYQAMSAGLARGIAALEAAGLAPPQNFEHTMEKLDIKDGDTGATALTKLAEQRQALESSLKAVMRGPLLTPDQKDEVQGLMDRVSAAIPWTPRDVNKVVFSKNPQQTFRDLATKMGIGAPAAQNGTIIQAPPQEAIQRLKMNPSEAAQFDEIFGPGSAKQVLGK